MPPALASESDLILVKDYVLLQIILDALDRDLPAVEASRLKFGPVYATVIASVQSRVVNEISRVRSAMTRAGIRVYEQERLPDAVQAKYLCRGYHNSFKMLWLTAKPELYSRVTEYLKAPE